MSNYMSHTTLDDYVVKPIGGVIVGNDGKAQSYDSDNKAAHEREAYSTKKIVDNYPKCIHYLLKVIIQLLTKLIFESALKSGIDKIISN